MSDSNDGRSALIDGLNNECMLHIFSFVGGKLASRPSSSPGEAPPSDLKTTNGTEHVEYVEEEVTDDEAAKKRSKVDEEEDKGLDILEAGRFYYNLAAVCRSWKEILDAHLSHLVTSLLIDVEFKGCFKVQEKKTTTCLDWLCGHKLSIASLRKLGCCLQTSLIFNNILVDGEDTTPELLSILKECDTSELRELYLFLVYGGSSTFRFDDGSAKEFNVMAPRQFLDEIARLCPKLKSVQLRLHLCLDRVSADDSSLISPSFFSLAGIDTLRILWYCSNPETVDSMFFCQLTQNLGNLQYLFLETVRQDHLGDTIYHIKSNSLAQLLVEDFTRHVTLSLDCPNLQVYRCKGFVSHGHPDQPRDIALQQKVARADNVPQSCLGLIRHVCNPTGLPIGFRFFDMVGPHVALLPHRRHHR